MSLPIANVLKLVVRIESPRPSVNDTKKGQAKGGGSDAEYRLERNEADRHQGSSADWVYSCSQSISNRLILPLAARTCRCRTPLRLTVQHPRSPGIVDLRHRT